MNGMMAQFPPSWTEHRTPDGRVYYNNALTKVTQWTKPEEMMSPAEVCGSSFLRQDESLTAMLAARSSQPAMEGIHG